MKPKCILFAGPGGCSKTPVAYYLSWNLNLPIFNNDTIRTEVVEEKLKYLPEDEEYLKRKNERLKQLLEKKISFIYDASVDRNWGEIKKVLDDKNFDYFIISYNLSNTKLIEMGKAKNYGDFEYLTRMWQKDHQEFINKHEKELGMIIDDNNFCDRLELSLCSVEKFMKQ